MAKLFVLWERIRASLWFIPCVLTASAGALALVLTRFERQELINGTLAESIAFGGGVDGARGVLTAIAGGMITVTGVVFSVTIVALQLASTQFTPRILSSFTGDRGNQWVLGVFIATFTYTLLVLRTIQSAADGEDPFVPRIAVSLAVVMLLASIVFLIYFIDHSAKTIQVHNILARVTRRTLDDIERLFPDELGEADDTAPTQVDARPAQIVTTDKSGYLEAVDGDSLFALGQQHNLVIRMEPFIGDFLVPGSPLARVQTAEKVDDQVEAAIRSAFILGPERTSNQDVEVGIIEIADVAVKALSPGINDPTTALRCIDRLYEVLLALGARRPPLPMRTREGNIHYVAKCRTYQSAVDMAFGQIHHAGCRNPAINQAVQRVLEKLVEKVPPSRGWRPATSLERYSRVTMDCSEPSPRSKSDESTASLT